MNKSLLQSIIVIGIVLFSSKVFSQQLVAPKKRPNVLLLVADDMNWDSPGCFGGAAPEITPNIDRLANEGIRFFNAHVNIAICTPSRSVMLTGLYPQNNGAKAFQRILPHIKTLPHILNEEGFLCGTIGKPLNQQELFRWSVTYQWQGVGDENKWGRDPKIYQQFSSSFFQMAKDSKQPFFLMASSHDPHRPYGGGKKEQENFERSGSSKTYSSDEVIVPEFIPDLPDTRKEMAAYCSSVRRLDDMMGTILDELKKSGHYDNTIVIFLSDHGMSLPFAKTNCYVQSTKTPLIIRWPGAIVKGTSDKEHMISTVDLMPTILEAVNISNGPPSDGRSFLPLLKGDSQEGRDAVYTQFNHVHGRNPYPMRSVITKEYSYIFNAWSNGERSYTAEPMAGLSFKAMKRAGEKDPIIRARIHHLQHRTVEEFYDLRKDPHSIKNLLNSKESQLGYEEEISKLRDRMLEWMIEFKDPAINAFKHRQSPESLEKFMGQFTANARAEKEALVPYEKAKGYRF
ncbi:sulfatase [Verrucomicrobiales bacterium]|nr:sulfatase [Verrucomicrobiales bacterium]